MDDARHKKRLEAQRARRARDPETKRKDSEAYRRRDCERSRVYALRSKYGITVEEYQEMHTQQGGLCKVCRQPERVPGRLLAVDHDHATGRVRGLLCGSCNTGIGIFRDSAGLLRAAAEYLEGA